MTETSLQDIENKLSAARTRLILDKPFLGALVLRLPLQAADPKWCPTTGTDAKKFYYNPEYIAELRADEAQFVLAHEALHCALSHFSRREHRVKHRWDIACDYAINPILVDEGLTPPPGSLMLREYRGMTAEEIYPMIKDNDMSESLDQHLYDKQEQAEGGQDKQQNPLDQKDNKTESGGSGDSQQEQQQQAKSDKPSQQPEAGQDNNQDTEKQESGLAKQNNDQSPQSRPADSSDDTLQTAEPDPLTESEKNNLHVQWQQRLAGAAQQAQQAGKLGEGMARIIDFFLQPTLPWRVLLSRYMNSISRDDYSYTRPSSRRGDPAIYPSLRSPQMNVVVAIDVSGSIDRDELNEFIAEVDSLKSQVRARVTFLTCDTKITGNSPWVFEAWEYCQLPDRIIGGGGTDFNPVFDWVELHDVRPDLLVYFTDAEGSFPESEASYPVTWLVKGKKPVPWGDRIQLN